MTEKRKATDLKRGAGQTVDGPEIEAASAET